MHLKVHVPQRAEHVIRVLEHRCTEIHPFRPSVSVESVVIQIVCLAGVNRRRLCLSVTNAPTPIHCFKKCIWFSVLTGRVYKQSEPVRRNDREGVNFHDRPHVTRRGIRES